MAEKSQKAGINVRLGDAGAPFDFSFRMRFAFAQKLEGYYRGSTKETGKGRKTKAFRKLKEAYSLESGRRGIVFKRRTRGLRKGAVANNALPDIPTLRKHWRIFLPAHFQSKKRSQIKS